MKQIEIKMDVENAIVIAGILEPFLDVTVKGMGGQPLMYSTIAKAINEYRKQLLEYTTDKDIKRVLNRVRRDTI